MRTVEPASFAVLVAKRREELRALLPQILGPSGSFVLEIGCGHGHFLTAYALAHPKTQCIGIDISRDRVTRAVRKKDRARAANLHFILAESDDFLASMPVNARMSGLFVLFPDPWPKRRHGKNRLIKASFLTEAAAFADKGSPLYLRTDHEPYFLESEEIVRAHPDWRISGEQLLPFEEPTVFEKRAPRHFTLVAVRR